MTFIPTPDCARVVIQYHESEMTFSNVLHFTKPNFTAANMTALANAIDNAVGAGWKTHLAANVTYDMTSVYDIRTIDGQVVSDSGNSGAGSQVGNAAALNCAIVVTLRTNARGRTGRGRVYCGGQLDNSLVANAWTVQARDNAAEYIEDIRTAASAIGWLHVIRSIQANKVTLNPAVTREVVAFDVRTGMTGTQRRRLDRG